MLFPFRLCHLPHLICCRAERSFAILPFLLLVKVARGRHPPTRTKRRMAKRRKILLVACCPRIPVYPLAFRIVGSDFLDMFGIFVCIHCCDSRGNTRLVVSDGCVRIPCRLLLLFELRSAVYWRESTTSTRKKDKTKPMKMERARLVAFVAMNSVLALSIYVVRSILFDGSAVKNLIFLPFLLWHCLVAQLLILDWWFVDDDVRLRWPLSKWRSGAEDPREAKRPTTDVT